MTGTRPPEAPEQIRAFLAASLPAPALRAIEALQRELHDAAHEKGVRLRWVPALGVHLTLKFFGEIPSASVPAIEREVQRALAEEAPIELALVGTGAFPNPRRARVLWLGLREKSGGRLQALQARLEASFEPIGFAAEKRAFKPHLTLARAPGESAADVQALVREDVVVLPSLELRELVLYRSELLSDGARHTPLCRVPFSHGNH